MQRNTHKSSFIREEETQLMERPRALLCSLGPGYRALRTGTDVSKILNSNSLPMGFGLLNNSFGDHMVYIFSETSFTTGQLFEMPLSRLRTFLLESRTKLLHTLSVLFDSLSAKRLTFRVSCQSGYAQIDSKGTTFRFIRRGSRNVKGYCKVEGAVTIEQIGLSFDRVHTGLLVATHAEGDKHSPLQCQERDFIQPFKGHQTFIIGYGPFRSEGWLIALVPLVAVNNLTNSSNSHLRRQIEAFADITIDHLLKLKFVSELLIEGCLSDIVTRIIESMHRLKKSGMLFWRWSQFQEHGLFHTGIIAQLEGYCHYHSNEKLKPSLRAAFFPPLDKITGASRKGRL